MPEVRSIDNYTLILFQLQNPILLYYGTAQVPEDTLEILKSRVLPKLSDRNIYTWIILLH